MKVSVIIPTYNYGKYLQESLSSVLKQTYSAFEIIIIDDGSTDNTQDFIQPYLSNPTVKYIKTENTGVSSARNTGIKLAKSPLIAFLDADDIWHYDKLEKQLPLFKNPMVGVVYSLKDTFNENGPRENYERGKLFRGNILPYLMTHNFICSSSAVVRYECLKKVGLFDSRLSQGEDMDLWLRIAAEGYEFDYVNLPLVDYREGGQASSPVQWEKRFRGNTLMFRNFFSHPRFKKKVTHKMRRQAWAALWRKRGYLLIEQKKRIQALRYATASLSYVPFNRMALGIIAKCLLPDFLVKQFPEQS